MKRSGKNKSGRRARGLMVLAMAAAGGSPARADVRYTITDLGALGGSGSQGFAINDSGQVAGYYTASGVDNAFRYSGGTMSGLGVLPTGTVSYGFGINNAGWVVGYGDTSTSIARPFLYNGTSLIALTGGGTGSAQAINSSHQVAGGNNGLPTRWDTDASGNPTAQVSLGYLPGGDDGSAYGINDAGQMVGFSHDPTTGNKAFFYDGTMHDLGNLGGATATAYSINGTAQVVGQAATGGGQTHGFFYDGSMHDIGVLSGGTSSTGYAINDHGDVVGTSSSASGARAISSSGGVLMDLNALINPASGWTSLSSAQAINRAGQITGTGIIGGQGHAFLLTPITTDYYYVGASGGAWTDGNNWSLSAGGAGGAGVPRTGDRAHVADSVSKSVSFSGIYSLPGLDTLEINGSGGASMTLSHSGGAMAASNAYVGGGAGGAGGSGSYTIAGGTATVGNTLRVYNAGTVQLTGGTLTATTITSEGTFNNQSGTLKFTTFNQTGGTHTVSGARELQIGGSSGTNGIYNLSGTGSLVVDGYEELGILGTGTLVQSGGTNTVGTGTVGTGLQLGYFSVGSGTYSLSGTGSLTVNGTEDIGFTGTGSFNQSGGTHTLGTTVANKSLNIGNHPGSSGTYNLSGNGTATVNGSVYVGGSSGASGGTGTLSQSGGILTITDTLKVWNSSSAVNLSAGSLTAGAIELADGVLTNTGNTLNFTTFTQTAGTHSISGGGQLVLARAVASNSTYTLSGGQLTSDNDESLGRAGAGTFIHSAGTHTVNGNLLMGEQAGGNGSYALSGNGSLIVSGPHSLYVGYGGSGQVNQSGGTASVSNLVMAQSAGQSGTYTLSSGTLAVAGDESVGSFGNATFTQSGGTHTAQQLDVAGNGTSGNNGNGVFNLSGGTLAVGVIENVGVAAAGVGGTAVFNHSGGTHSINSEQLIIGHNGTYNLSGTGTLTSTGAVSQLIVSGTFHQFSANSSATFQGPIRMAQTAGENATYTLDSGTLTSGYAEYIGESGSATFVQNGGVHTISGSLYIANNAGSSGTYNLNGGTLNISGNIVNNGTMTQANGTLNLGGTYTGNGIIQTYGLLTIADGTAIDMQDLHIAGGTASATGTIMVGKTTGSPGILNVSGGTTTLGVLGIGNAGTSTSGSGSGTLNVSAGTLYADTILEGSTVGGSGNVTINGTGEVTVGGGLSYNSVTVAGNGKLTVLDQNPPAGEDPVLNRSIVGGYLRDGAIHVNGGVVTSPKIKLGITAGKTGTYTQSAGTVTVGILAVGNDASLTSGAGTGSLSISGGTLNADTILEGSTTGGSGDITLSGAAVVNVGGGMTTNTLTVNGGALHVLDQNPPAGEDPELNRSIVGGYLRDGAMHVHGGTVTSPKIKLGITSGKTGTYTQDGGSVTVSVLAAGNDADINSGSGTGTINISGGSLYADTVMLGSTAGGSGDMTISGTGDVTVGGGLTSNDVTITGNGHLTVLNQNPPMGEDPVLNRSIVGGYLRDGAIHVHGGVVASPKIKLGITAGKTGSYDQDGGTVTVTTLGVGNDADINSGAGTGHVTVSGGTMNVGTVLCGSTVGGSGDFTISGTGNVIVGGAFSSNHLIMNGGTLTVLDQNGPPGEDPVLDRSMVGGYLRDGSADIHGGTVTSPKVKLGVTAGKTGTYTQDGGAASFGIFGVGNDATMTGGAGSGVLSISGGTLYADTILEGSTVGGSGNVTINGTGEVTVGGGFTMNSVTVSGNGKLTVLDQNPPAGEDPVLNRSIVGGYLRDGAMNVNGGTVVSPKMKLGVTAGKTGTLTQSAGTLTVTTLGVGNDATTTGGAGVGIATIAGGQLTAGSILIGSSAGGTGSFTWNNGVINATLLNLAGPGSTVTVGAGGPHKALKVNTLTIAGSSDNWTATVDLTSNDLIIQSTSGGAAAAYANAYNQVKSAINGGGGPWTGNGITSSTAAADTNLLYAVGIISNNDSQFGGAGDPLYPTFSGQSADANAILIKSTYFGDANLDGTIDITDYGLIDTAFNNQTVNGGWVNGDFDFSGGTIDISDYGLIDGAFGNQGGPLRPDLTGAGAGVGVGAGAVAVPEPTGVAGLGMLALLAGGALGKRRRNRAR